MANNFQITSPAFIPNGPIPEKYTADGENLSPPLAWSPPPEGAKSLALIVDDPDASSGVWVHWVLYNLPVNTRQLHENSSRTHDLPKGAVEGLNSSKKIGYSGARPPSGTHRYFFKLYALDAILELAPGATRMDLDQAMRGHIVARDELIGTYSHKSAVPK